MLVLTRKLGEKISIGNDITVVVTGIHGTYVKLGVEAPRNIAIYREEVLARTIRENRSAAGANIQELRNLLANKFKMEETGRREKPKK
ncbi:MAG: carbon storage regulator CsrA [Nitrospiria bacterium]